MGLPVLYRPAEGGQELTLDAMRHDAVDLTLPQAGTWSLSVVAYDAMGKQSLPSAPVTVTETIGTGQTYLPNLSR